ncbi:hypothetical protein [Pandoraea sp. B-6]|uniref:hypothetical protein n=1 Tax=Pandoraea sp. B-6 TaxID=1204340 RepID=UPI0012FB1E79|nr:hypothetical protein [Pandoraea sp. B-6]
MVLGIDPTTNLFYEGSAILYGHAISPSPFVSIAAYVGQQSGWSATSKVETLQNATMVFREDSFDPVARIRRGRMYERTRTPQPSLWRVQQHPAYAGQRQLGSLPHSMVSADPEGYFIREMYAFDPWQAPEALLRNRQDALIVLGSGDRSTPYTILDIERLTTGEDLITLRTRASLGVLPDINLASVPETLKSLVSDLHEKAASSAFRDDAESVVDRCREAATAAITSYLVSEDPDGRHLGKELGQLANIVNPPKDGSGKLVMGCAARILARLHSRGKGAERAGKGNKPPSEADAECALALLGAIYREAGLAPS